MDGLLHLFDGHGVELEYMIVDRNTLSVLPVADEVIRAITGRYQSDAEVGELTWSNELVLHVIELKTSQPAPSLAPLADAFRREVRHVNEILEAIGGRLMPTAMHPWMDPSRETRLWPHDFSPVYDAFNRIFDCRGHGWSNVQCVHLNLPFANEEEFGRLHAAIRILLPILPALAASSPLMGGRATGFMDTRLDEYRTNSRRVPSVSGRVIPEPAFDYHDYHEEILAPMYRDIAPLDPTGILQEEWLNARGAIARFDRGAIEIRLLDIQECPSADVALLAAIVAVLKALVAERWVSYERQRAWAVGPLEAILLSTIREGDASGITDDDYLGLFGMRGLGSCTAGQLWAHIVESSFDEIRLQAPEQVHQLQTILENGCLARRILAAFRTERSADPVAAIYRRLCECLADDALFLP